MKIAIIGAGLCGLAVASALLDSQDVKIDLFDEKGIGGGASGVSCGLVHPYPGEEGKRSLMAMEALSLTRALLDRIPGSTVGLEGVVRVGRDEEETQRLRVAFSRCEDIEESSGSFLIKSGRTVNMPRYLEGLFRMSQERGAALHVKRVENLEELKEYDQIVIAAGAGIKLFSECEPLKVQLIKGQLLTCHYDTSVINLQRSLIGKGYIGLGEGEGRCMLGATYERGYTSSLPDLEVAKQEILTRVGSFFPQVSLFEIDGCRAGIRVARKGHYLPIIRKLKERVWVCTAMGSRGLLYHAFAGKMLAKAILADSESEIYPQFL
ncbi:MAG: FAD-binding oxidoreductase [Chlamydiales bacterium]|nr:FAD-binding oxidoreductase [Chlamydiales bacterium]